MVYVIFSKDKRNIERSKGLQWSYLGADEGLSRVEALLGGDKREFIGREIDRVVSLVRDNFVDYIGLTSTLQKDKVLWYSARAASKSFSQTTMFQQYIYIKLIESYAASEGSHLFIIDDFRLLANLELARLPDVMVQSRAVPDLTDIALNKAKGVLRSFRFIFYWVAFKLIFSSEAPKGGDILLHSFIDSRIFSRLPEYNDPYFGELAGFLDKNGHNVLRVTPLSVSLKHAFIIKKHFKNTIFLLSLLI